MQKAVIFDVDGTLIDSVDLHARAWQNAFSDFGHEIAFEDIRSQIGKGGDQFIPVFLPEGELDAKGEELEKHRSKVLEDRYLPPVTPLPGVRELPQRLQADTIRIALAFSVKEDKLYAYKQAADFVDLLDAETSSDDTESGKLDTDLFIAAMRHLGGFAPEQAIVVGNTPYDAKADLRKAGCIITYEDPADLLAQYDTSPLAQSPAWPATSPESI